MSRSREPQVGPLRSGESVVVELEGVVCGYSRWSALGTIVGVLVALSIPRMLRMSFIVGVIVIVVVVTVAFLTLYYVVGRRLAATATPAMGSPYLLLALTSQRVLLLDRGLGAEEPQLIETAAIADVGTLRYDRAGWLRPQRLGYVIDGTDKREFEFPRGQPVSRFVEEFA